MKRASGVVLFIAIMLFAFAANGAKSGGWKKEGVTPQEMERDKAECIQKSQKGAGRAARALQGQRFSLCMKEKGYQTVQ